MPTDYPQVAATEQMLLMNEYAPGDPNQMQGWDAIVVRSIGDGVDGEISVIVPEAYSGIADVAANIDPDGGLIAQDGPAEVHIPSGSVIERFKLVRFGDERGSYSSDSSRYPDAGMFAVASNGVARI